MPAAKKTKKETKKEAKSTRAPVVTVMGHVDHGKTTFLDSIRGTKVAAKEAGGITQNTRAHEVITKNGFRITFIDTPGHEAFSKMRSRGAKVTDFVLLIVAADDGVQPQTKESIKFAKENNVPIIVAINKIDIKGINLQKIKTELSSFGVMVEEYGGDTLCFEISAREKIGLEAVLDGIQLLSEISELAPKTPKEDSLGEAFVLESSLDKKIGNVALCIMKAGNLDQRYFGVTKDTIFKVRAYLDENQGVKNQVLESQPFWVTGLKSTLAAGETLYFAENEEKAEKLQKHLSEEYKITEENPEIKDLDPESLFAQMLVKREEIKQGIDQKKLNVIVKSSTEGTLEAILNKLNTMSTDESKINILEAGTGDVSEDDIMRAKLAKGIIVTFQLPTPNKIESIAKTEKVLVRNYEIIYELFDEVEEVLSGLGAPQEEEIEVARARVKQTFTLSDKSVVAGCEVIKGNILKGYKVWVERNGEEVARGRITSLKVRKDEVKEVKKGSECGIILEPSFEELAEGDEIVTFKLERY